jgi:hypothetical protein
MMPTSSGISRGMNVVKYTGCKVWASEHCAENMWKGPQYFCHKQIWRANKEAALFTGRIDGN